MLTAILTCRNAEATIERCLRHLLWHGAKVVVVDNGSVDGTVDIIKKFPEVDLRSDPYSHAFDLTRQLRLKKSIIEELASGWIIHSDADEFIDAPGGLPLSRYLPLWEGTDVLAFPCEELMFLPLLDTERHAPDDFERTMTSFAPFAERDPKQRVFRADAPLKRWLETGGHTIEKDPRRLAPEKLVLRHYPGLSLDHFRAQYLPRIFSANDLGKFWHNSRRGSSMRVVTPNPDAFSGSVRSDKNKPIKNMPVFEELPKMDKPRSVENSPDLELVTLGDASRERMTGQIHSAIPGLRIGQGSVGCPRLVIFEHPVFSLRPEHDVVTHAEHWLRTSAAARQAGLCANAPYAELRLEDALQSSELVLGTLQRLLVGPAGYRSFAKAHPVHNDDAFVGRIADITGVFARELGYG